MKYLCLVLIVAVGYLSIQLIKTRRDLAHQDKILTATVEACGEFWLRVPLDKKYGIK